MECPTQWSTGQPGGVVDMLQEPLKCQCFTREQKTILTHALERASSELSRLIREGEEKEACGIYEREKEIFNNMRDVIEKVPYCK